MNESIGDLEMLTRRMRGKLVELSHKAKTPHLGSSLSCVDIVAAAYHVLNIRPHTWTDPCRDRFLLSKGHAATTLYVALAMHGFISDDLLESYAKPGSPLAEHPSPGVPGIENASGSLGHGLGLGIGMALAGKIQNRDYKVCVLLSDGECNEGTVWEAALFAPAQRLERLIAIIDYNKWQATGRSNEIMALSPLREKWSAFGWSAHDVDGHDLDQSCERLRKIPDGSGKPLALIAHTIKGKGVSFMEDDNNWHYRIPTTEEVLRAHKELGLV